MRGEQYIFLASIFWFGLNFAFRRLAVCPINDRGKTFSIGQTLEATN